MTREQAAILDDICVREFDEINPVTLRYTYQNKQVLNILSGVLTRDDDHAGWTLTGSRFCLGIILITDKVMITEGFTGPVITVRLRGARFTHRSVLAATQIVDERRQEFETNLKKEAQP